MNYKDKLNQIRISLDLHLLNKPIQERFAETTKVKVTSLS
jgi:hypothetical protein